MAEIAASTSDRRLIGSIPTFGMTLLSASFEPAA